MTSTSYDDDMEQVIEQPQPLAIEDKSDLVRWKSNSAS